MAHKIAIYQAIRRNYIPWVLSAVFIGLALMVPWLSLFYESPFLLRFASRVLIFALAATALNFIMGYGGLVSFGHALFFGLGAYSVAIPASLGIENGLLQFGLDLMICAAIGWGVGMIALRTSGIGFIMISLAFAQMFYYVFVGLKNFGGDDGLSIHQGSQFLSISLAQSWPLYYTALGSLFLCILASSLIAKARFGMVLRGAAMNKPRLESLGYNVRKNQLIAFVVAAMVTGFAGLLYANLTLYAAPSYLAWPMSGDFIIIVVLGGLARAIGPFIGAVALLSAEELLQRQSEHWMFWLGAMIVVLALSGKGGIVDGFYAGLSAWRNFRLSLSRQHDARKV